MNSLESRKQLLVAESELNRAHLAQDWQMLADEIHGLTHKAKTIGGLASAATLLASLLFLRRKKTAPTAGKSPWWQTTLKSVGLVSSLWQLFRNRPKT